MCKHFLRNKCRHGFSGRKPYEGRKECPWIHPKICMSFLNYGFGENGCRLKDKCSKTHPKICRESLKNRTCNSDGDKCKYGYHLKNTVRKNEGDTDDRKEENHDMRNDTAEKRDMRNKINNERRETHSENVNKLDQGFLEEIIKKTLISLLGIQAKPPEKKETFLDQLIKKLIE